MADCPPVFSAVGTVAVLLSAILPDSSLPEPQKYVFSQLFFHSCKDTKKVYQS
jgi:hypothetical protein